MPNPPPTLIESWLPFEAIGAESLVIPAPGWTRFGRKERCGACQQESREE